MAQLLGQLGVFHTCVFPSLACGATTPTFGGCPGRKPSFWAGCYLVSSDTQLAVIAKSIKVEGSLIRQLWGAPHPTYHERPPTPQIAGGYYPGPDCYTRPLSAPSTAGTTTTHFPNQESARQARARDLEFCSVPHRCPFDICEISTPQARMPSLR